MKDGFSILDGGMGRELKRIGAPFRQPEWSALALIEAPDAVREVHTSFLMAGADIITTNSYALVPFHIGAERFAAEAGHLADRAGRLAREAAACSTERSIRVAASLPPLFGSYRPDLFEPSEAQALLAPLVSGLSPHADIWLAETLSALAEAEVVAQALKGDQRPIWYSFTLDDSEAALARAPCLRSGESVASAAAWAIGNGASALLFNCSQPEVMEAAVRAARDIIDRGTQALPVGVYANAFPPQPKEATANETLLPIRDDLDPLGYLAWVRSWVEAGATIVGGCCGISPAHIAEISALRDAA